MPTAPPRPTGLIRSGEIGAYRRLRRRRAFFLFTVVIVLLAATACGDDDDDGTGSAAGGDPGIGQATDDGACAGTDLSFTNLETGVTGTATAALAESGADGGLYTAYAADFAIDEDDLRSWRPEVPAGNNVITVQLTVFNATEDPEPIEPGTVIDGTPGDNFGELTFVTRHFTHDEDWSTTQNTGDTDDLPKEMTVTGVGDTFCFEIEFVDQEKQIAGTVEASVFRRN